MKNNVLTFKPDRWWDVRLTGQRFSVKYGARKIVVDMRFRNSGIEFRKLSLVVDDVPVKVSPRGGVEFPMSNNKIGPLTFGVGRRRDFSIFGVEPQTNVFLRIRKSARAGSLEEAWKLVF
jgi:hypothetical protein